MIIYFVNKNCKLKGPLEIRLSNGESLKSGDICVLSTDAETVAYLLTDFSKTWNKCKTVGRAMALTDCSKDWSNFLLYSFDGFSKREGDIIALETILLKFDDQPFGDLIKIVIRILKNEIDCIDASVLASLYSNGLSVDTPSSHLIGRTTDSPDLSDTFTPFIFYLPEEIQNEARSLLRMRSIKETVSKLRTEYKKEFKIAFEKFINDNPGHFIHEGFV